jgi:hypothetical protein
MRLICSASIVQISKKGKAVIINSFLPQPKGSTRKEEEIGEIWQT